MPPVNCTTRRYGSVAPASTRSSEVLPAPFRPVSPTLSPARTLKLAWSSVTTPPTSTASSRTANMRTSVAGPSPKLESVDLAVAAFPVRGPQLVLLELAGGGAGQLVAELDRRRALEVGQSAPAVLDELGLGH